MAKETEATAVLVLADGTVFHGKAAGKIGQSYGEICFNTGMTGYQEIFTDPSYNGQIMVTTNAHIGNYGTRNKEQESGEVQISGLVCRNFAGEGYSRPMGDQSIQEYLEENNIVCIHSIDTRSLVRHIREQGAMNAIISNDTTNIEGLLKQLQDAPNMDGLELASKVSTTAPYFVGDENASTYVAVMDFGVKRSILDNLASRGCYLKVFPAKTPFEEVAAWKPDGFFLSNGPGDPGAMDYAVETVQQILDTGKPVFGICLGHQLIARSVGIKTTKMHHGHRGINHPVKNLITGRSEITSQNHGFGLDTASVEALADKVEVTHINLNDDTIEGIRLKGKNVFSVQYHPEASPGPHDSRYLFDDFMKFF